MSDGHHLPRRPLRHVHLHGLGLRLRKSDPTGSYWYLCDGVSPASDVLSDGYSSFTPGISEINGLGSRFYLADVQGNSRGLLDANQNNTDGYNWDAWGNSVSRFGSNPTGFAWNVSSGYQSDGDSGLKLLGHRYYDSRTGRFISQDPAGDGDNWYAYADNDPTDGVDPLGLEPEQNLQPDWGNTSDPNWMKEPAGHDPGSTYDCPGVGLLTVGSDGKWHPGGGPAAALSGTTTSYNFSFSKMLGVGIGGIFRSYPDGIMSGFTGPKTFRFPTEIAPGAAQTSLLWDQTQAGPRIYKARTYGRLGQRIIDFDFAGKTNDGPYPHAHKYVENATGGTQQRSKIKLNIRTGRPFEEGEAGGAYMQFREEQDPVPFIDLFELL